MESVEPLVPGAGQGSSTGVRQFSNDGKYESVMVMIHLNDRDTLGWQLRALPRDTHEISHLCSRLTLCQRVTGITFLQKPDEKKEEFNSSVTHYTPVMLSMRSVTVGEIGYLLKFSSHLDR